MDILNYINGEWIKQTVKEYFGVINPATGQVIAQTPFGNTEDVDTAAPAASYACQQCG
jgi:acyl-CoA reductase-like NAD-dependent aldehyde dehydrogenase